MSGKASGMEAGFVGRGRERSALTEAVLRNGTGVVVVRGGPGFGKSSLVSHWLAELQTNGHRFQRIFAGSAGRSANARSPQSLLQRLLEFLPTEETTKTAPVVDRLLHSLRRHPSLVVLDGMDVFAPNGVRDPNLSDLWLWLRECGRTGASRVVITSRVELPNLEQSDLATTLSLGQLTPAEGAELLAGMGVRNPRRCGSRKDDPELHAASRELGGHPLGLSLLGHYLMRAHDGDIRRRHAARLQPGAASVDGIVSAFQTWFGDGPELSLLRLVALSDGLASMNRLFWLAEQPRLSPLTGSLKGLSRDSWDWALSVLHECGLIKLRDDSEIGIPRLVQDSIRESIERSYPEIGRHAGSG